MARELRYTNRLTVPLTAEDTARLDAARVEGETRLDVIRGAIQRELRRRDRRAASASPGGASGRQDGP